MERDKKKFILMKLKSYKLSPMCISLVSIVMDTNIGINFANFHQNNKFVEIILRELFVHPHSYNM